jgi:hypothetical protein
MDERFMLSVILGVLLISQAGVAKSAATPVQNPRVLFITSSECPACKGELDRLQKPGGEFERMRSLGWKIGNSTANHIQIIVAEDNPEMVQRMRVHSYPTVVGVSDGEIVRSFSSGCTTPLDAWTFAWLATGINSRPHPVIPELIKVQSTGHFPLRGNHWSIDGDWNPTQQTVIAHLRGPNHARQVLRFGTIESWSYEELRSLHDYLHERETPTVTARPSSNRPRGTTGKSNGNF